jgi:biotin operon repressor
MQANYLKKEGIEINKKEKSGYFMVKDYREKIFVPSGHIKK